MNFYEVLAVVDNVKCDGYTIVLCGARVDDRPYIQITKGARGGRKWYLSPFMTKSEIVQTCLMAVLAFAEHEIREHFTYKDDAVFGPHISVDRLAEICNNLD